LHGYSQIKLSLPGNPSSARSASLRRVCAARCPIHGGDSPMSLALNEEKGVYFCHVCHASGDQQETIVRRWMWSVADSR
jgi:hypothetical protein